MVRHHRIRDSVNIHNQVAELGRPSKALSFLNVYGSCKETDVDVHIHKKSRHVGKEFYDNVQRVDYDKDLIFRGDASSVRIVVVLTTYFSFEMC